VIPARSADTNGPHRSTVGAWSRRARLASVLVTTVLYVPAFLFLYPLIGWPSVALSLLPVVAGGWLLGLRAGLVAGVMVSLVNVLLLGLVTREGWIPILWGGSAFILWIAAGAVAGWLSELLDRMKTQSREREALEEEIKQRKRVEEALRQSEKLASAGQLLAGVAHELNNLLTMILGGADLLRTMVGSGPLREEAEEIAKAAERSARIVKNLLALSRRRPPERQYVSLNQIVREAIELLTYALRADHVEIAFNLAQDLPIIWADPHQLHQVVINLVFNAQQAMRQTSPPRHLTLTTQFDRREGRVALRVADSGPGIPPEIQARIFEPFFTTKPPGEGTGLGLSLCQSIIQGFGGAIRVESPPGQGAVFSVELPVNVAANDQPKARVSEQVPRQQKTILVVDDEPGILKTLKAILSADGHQVETATNGVVALQKLRERAYDVILSDVKMPQLDGPGLYREIEHLYPGLEQRIIFITGDLLSPQTRAFVEETGASYLSKPIVVDEVRQVVQRATAVV